MKRIVKGLLFKFTLVFMMAYFFLSTTNYSMPALRVNSMFDETTIEKHWRLKKELLKIRRQKLPDSLDLKGEGALEKGNWIIITQDPETDIYGVNINNKQVIVIAEAPVITDEHRQAVISIDTLRKFIQEKGESSYSILVEKGFEEKIKHFKPKEAAMLMHIHSFFNRANEKKELSSLFEGVAELANSGKIAVEEAGLVIAIELLGRVGILLEKDMLKFYLDDMPFDRVSEQAYNILSDLGIAIEDSLVIKRLLNAYMRRPAVLKEAVKLSNKIIQLAYEQSNYNQTEVIRGALRSDNPDFLIWIEKGHLKSLISTGNIAEYTDKALLSTQIKENHVQLAVNWEKGLRRERDELRIKIERSVSKTISPNDDYEAFAEEVSRKMTLIMETVRKCKLNL